MNTVLSYYERRGVVAKAMLCGLLVALIGMLFDCGVKLLRWPWLQERVFENVIEGAL